MNDIKITELLLDLRNDIQEDFNEINEKMDKQLSDFNKRIYDIERDIAVHKVTGGQDKVVVQSHNEKNGFGKRMDFKELVLYAVMAKLVGYNVLELTGVIK